MSARPQPQMIQLYPPADEAAKGAVPAMFTPDNAADMQRRRKWTTTPPGTPQRVKQNVELRPEERTGGDTMAGVLDSYRKQCAELGIKYDLSWGVARLKAEITKQTAQRVAASAPIESPEEVVKMQTLEQRQREEDDEDAKLLAELEAEEEAERATQSAIAAGR